MNPDNYGTLEACKKLAEILAKKGIAVEAEFWWVNFPKTGWDIVKKADAEFVDRPDSIPAYSMPKVWRELPDIIISDKFKERICRLTLERDSATGETYASYENYQEKCAFWAKSPNPVDALIYLWIWVMEQEESHDKNPN